MAKKRQDKSIASLLGNREINDKIINKATEELHNSKANEALPVKEKEIRVTVSTPKSLYLLSKSALIESDMSSLKEFYLFCVKKYLIEQGKM